MCGRCRHCLAGRRNLCHSTIGLGVGRDGAFAEYVVLPMTNIWHHWPGVDPEIAAIFDPFGNAVHTALAFPDPRRGRPRQRGGADRPDGDGRRPPRRRPPRRRVATRTRTGASWRCGWARRSPSIRASGDLRAVAAELGHGRRVRRRARDVRRPGRHPRRDRGDGPRRRDRPPGDPDRGDHDGPQRHRLQDADAARDLRSGDVRDLVQDDRDAPVRARHRARHHPSIRRSATSRRRSPPPGRASPARSSWTGRHDRSAGLPRRRTRDACASSTCIGRCAS